MNGLESEYASHLWAQQIAGGVLWYSFDAIKVRLAGNTFYSPDFLVLLSDLTLEVHEVKGSKRDKKTGQRKPYVEDDAAVKIKVAAEKYPMRFFMVWKDEAGRWARHEY